MFDLRTKLRCANASPRAIELANSANSLRQSKTAAQFGRYKEDSDIFQLHDDVTKLRMSNGDGLMRLGVEKMDASWENRRLVTLLFSGLVSVGGSAGAISYFFEAMDGKKIEDVIAFLASLAIVSVSALVFRMTRKRLRMASDYHLCNEILSRDFSESVFD